MLIAVVKRFVGSYGGNAENFLQDAWASTSGTGSNIALRANDTEFLATISLQSAGGLNSLASSLSQAIEQSFQYRSIKGVFGQQNSVYPADNSLQLENFGALIPWEEILDMVVNNSSRRLLIMMRHGQAWENLNPGNNSACEFELEGLTIQNFDSELTPLGVAEALRLNSLLKSPYLPSSGSSAGTFMNPVATATANETTWFEAIGLSDAAFFVSPLTRTMQTTERVLGGGLLSPASTLVTASEMLRASIGTDVCNYRRSVRTPTSYDSLPAPWNSGCGDDGGIPRDSLSSVYGSSKINFNFPIRPAGGSGIGLISDGDQLWRSDVEDSSQITRARVFVNQLFDVEEDGYGGGRGVIFATTHGEMIDAMYQALGDNSYSALNTEVVPVVIEQVL